MSIIFLPSIVHPFGIHQPIYPPRSRPSCYPAANQPSIYTPNNDTLMLYSFVTPCIHSWIHPYFFLSHQSSSNSTSFYPSIHPYSDCFIIHPATREFPSIHPSIIHSPVRSTCNYCFQFPKDVFVFFVSSKDLGQHAFLLSHFALGAHKLLFLTHNEISLCY